MISVVLMKGRRRLRIGGDEDLEGGRMAELLHELAAVTAGCSRDRESDDSGTPMNGEVGEEELLSMYRLIQRDTGELEVTAKKNATVRTEANGADAEVGDWRAGEGLGLLYQGGEEVENGGEA